MQSLARFTVGGLFQEPPTEKIVSLFDEHEEVKAQIESVASIMSGPSRQGTIPYFLKGNTRGDQRHSASVLADHLFTLEGALAALHAEYWDKVLKLTDVLDCMPQKRRDEWYEMIREHKVPEFNRKTVSSTLTDLLSSREKFFAERVDGIFTKLSGQHLTNSPSGFRKRMIMAYVIDPKWGHADWSRCGYINDLRVVIARFMGRGDPGYSTTQEMVNHAYQYNRGKWFTIDGGALRMRVYGKGTVHLEVHPDMAWKLNKVLAYLHPHAIPEEHRRKPPKASSKSYTLMDKPLPFEVVNVLSTFLKGSDRVGRSFSYGYAWSGLDKHLRAEVTEVMTALGGVEEQRGVFRFDYEARAVLAEVVASGVVPEHKSHQFYPTPRVVAQRLREWAQVSPEHSILEPSAGLGSLVEGQDPSRVTCVEVSPLHCSVLESKGFQVLQGDFLSLSLGLLFDRVLMNPPFSQGRWKQHLERASQHVCSGGLLVSVLPASARGKELLPGWHCEFSEEIPHAFSGTGISVVLLRAKAP